MRSSILQGGNYVIKKIENRKFEACGKIAWLWSASPLHQAFTTSLQARFILPAVELGNFHILEAHGMPAAYCSWAMMSREAEARYVLNPSGMKLEDWTSGDRLWFIDWISPFSSRFTWRLKQTMAEEKFPNSVARSYKVKGKSSKARVATFIGAKLTKQQSYQLRRKYHLELTEELRKLSEADQSFALRDLG